MLNELRQVINEELGISSEVVNLSKRFYNEMIESLATPEKVEKSEIMIKKTCSMRFSFDVVTVNSSIVYRNFLSKDYSKVYETPYVTDGGSFMLSKKMFFCFINFYGVCGTINKEKAMETIQHEIEHIYQQSRMGKDFGREEIYVQVKNDMRSTDPIRQKVAKMLYYSFKSEQEGFANGLYGYIMDKNQPYTEDLLKESEAWEIYTFLKQGIIELKTNEEMKMVFNEYFVRFGVKVSDIERETENFLRRIGRVVIKVQKDKDKQGWR